MGLWDIFKKSRRESHKHARMLNGFTPIFSQFGQDIYASDVVRQAISCIATEVKKLEPQHVLKKGSDITPVYDEVQSVLEYPNPLMSMSDLLEKVVWQLYFNYNSFILPVWDKYTGKLKELYPIQPTQVDFLQDASNTYFVKLTFANNYEATIRYEDVIHIRHEYSVNEFMGGDATAQPDHKALLKTLELNNVLLDGVSKALKSSFAINGVLKYNTLLDADKSQKALEELTDAIRSNESGFMPLDLKGEFIPFKREIKLVDEATLKFIDEKILRNFGVPPGILIGKYETWEYEAFYQKTLEPLIKSMSQAFTRCLFSKRESFGFGHRIVFYSRDLLFLNTKEKLEYLRMLGDTGTLYENEKRTLMGLRPLPELEGVRLQSLNYVNSEIAIQYQLGLYGKKQEEEEEQTAPTSTEANLEEEVEEDVEETQ